MYQPIFIIGAARSGTKILRDVLASHSSLDNVPYDINYIWKLGNEDCLHDELSIKNITPETSLAIKNEINKFHADAPYLLEKTVSNCLRLPYVEEIFPKVKYIFLIRDGRAVVESAMRQWHAPTDWNYIIKKARTFPLIKAPGYAWAYIRNLLKRHYKLKGAKLPTWGPRYEGIDQDVLTKDLLEVCTIQWVHSIKKALLFFETIDLKRVIKIRYEDFVHQPEKTVQQIANYLDIDFDEYLDNNIFSSISTSNIGKWEKNLSQEQKLALLPLVRETLINLGYVLD